MNPKNYRPISLTSVICKTMEHVIVAKPINKTSRNEQNLDQESIWL